jgi:hypothetical protein
MVWAVRDGETHKKRKLMCDNPESSTDPKPGSRSNFALCCGLQRAHTWFLAHRFMAPLIMTSSGWEGRFLLQR